MIQEKTIPALVQRIKTLTEKAAFFEDLGFMKKSLEVTEKSFVQILWPTIKNNKVETWNYFQCKVTELEHKDSLIGAYIGERVGLVKVIGIFEVVDASD